MKPLYSMQEILKMLQKYLDGVATTEWALFVAACYQQFEKNGSALEHLAEAK